LLLIIAAFGIAEAQESADLQWISWAATPGAAQYQVEVRVKGGATVLSALTAETSLVLKLAPGEYEANITVINKFQKPAGSTGWKPLTVKRTATPRVDSFDSEPLVAGGSGRVEIEGERFIAESQVFLEKGELAIKARAARVESPTRIVAEFSLEGAAPGSYRLVVENPPRLRAEAAILVEVYARKAPRIDSVSQARFVNDAPVRNLIVRGEDFELGAAISIETGFAALVPDTRYRSGRELAFDLDAGMAPGSYDLVVTNPGGLSARLPKALVVTAPESPFAASLSPKEARMGPGRLSAQIEGAGLKAPTEAWLESEGASVRLEREGSERDDLYVGSAPYSSLSPGSWDLALKRAGQTVMRLPRAITIQDDPSPLVTGLSPDAALAGGPLALRASGQRLEKATGARLASGALRVPLSMELGPGAASLELKAGTAIAGTWDLELNYDGGIYRYPRAVRVADAATPSAEPAPTPPPTLAPSPLPSPTPSPAPIDAGPPEDSLARLKPKAKITGESLAQGPPPTFLLEAGDLIYPRSGGDAAIAPPNASPAPSARALGDPEASPTSAPSSGTSEALGYEALGYEARIEAIYFMEPQSSTALAESKAVIMGSAIEGALSARLTQGFERFELEILGRSDGALEVRVPPLTEGAYDLELSLEDGSLLIEPRAWFASPPPQELFPPRPSRVSAELTDLSPMGALGSIARNEGPALSLKLSSDILPWLYGFGGLRSAKSKLEDDKRPELASMQSFAFDMGVGLALALGPDIRVEIEAGAGVFLSGSSGATQTSRIFEGSYAPLLSAGAALEIGRGPFRMRVSRSYVGAFFGGGEESRLGSYEFAEWGFGISMRF
jgi:hypothetical protein